MWPELQSVAAVNRSPARCPSELTPQSSCRREKWLYWDWFSTKGPELEKLDDLKRRIDEAAKFISLDQLAISPQCGFASDIVGNRINIEEQKRKLERVVETARQVWA